MKKYCLTKYYLICRSGSYLKGFVVRHVIYSWNLIGGIAVLVPELLLKAQSYPGVFKIIVLLLKLYFWAQFHSRTIKMIVSALKNFTFWAQFHPWTIKVHLNLQISIVNSTLSIVLCEMLRCYDWSALAAIGDIKLIFIQKLFSGL
jgi:hypothetical protein